MVEFADVVRRRRMVRNYRPDPVDREVIERICAAACRGPSAGFSQGLYVVVVTDDADRARIAELCDEPAYVAQGFDPWVSRAAVHLIPCVRAQDYRDRYAEPDKAGAGGPHEWPVPFWWVDGGAMLMLILLAAVDEGLGAGFLGSWRRAELCELLGIPADVEPLGIVTVGHPAPDRRSGSLSRGRRPDQIRWSRWQ